VIDAPSDVVQSLVAARRELLAARPRSGLHALPSRDALLAVVNGLRAALFPDHGSTSRALSDASAPSFISEQLANALTDLRSQVLGALWFGCTHEPRRGDDCRSCGEQADALVRTFASRLPTLRALLGLDVRAAYEGDPALPSLDEALLCYPGVTAIVHHRIAHELHLLGIPLVPRIIAALAHAVTGVDIHPGAQIGGSFFIDHGTGVVIGETCVIGERVRLYQGVTLGAKSFELDEHGHPRKRVARHPVVEDDVIIYANATILGRITIGRGSSIGGNVWVTRDVPPGSRITQAQARSESFGDGGGI